MNAPLIVKPRELEFLEAVDALMIEIGAALAAPHEHIPTYVFPTWHGVLWVRPFAGKLAPKIYCRFANPHWVQEIPDDFNRLNGRWNHCLWPDWRADFEPGLTVFAQRLNDIKLSCDPLSSTDKPIRRPDGSVVRFCKWSSCDAVEITTTAGELWSQPLTSFREGKKPRLRTATPWEWGTATRTLRLNAPTFLRDRD